MLEKASVEVYHLIENSYQPLAANDRGHYFIPQLGAELGIWQGHYSNTDRTYAGGGENAKRKLLK